MKNSKRASNISTFLSLFVLVLIVLITFTGCDEKILNSTRLDQNKNINMNDTLVVKNDDNAGNCMQTNLKESQSKITPVPTEPEDEMYNFVCDSEGILDLDEFMDLSLLARNTSKRIGIDTIIITTNQLYDTDDPMEFIKNIYAKMDNSVDMSTDQAAILAYDTPSDSFYVAFYNDMQYDSLEPEYDRMCDLLDMYHADSRYYEAMETFINEIHYIYYPEDADDDFYLDNDTKYRNDSYDLKYMNFSEEYYKYAIENPKKYIPYTKSDVDDALSNNFYGEWISTETGDVYTIDDLRINNSLYGINGATALEGPIIFWHTIDDPETIHVFESTSDGGLVDEDYNYYVRTEDYENYINSNTNNISYSANEDVFGTELSVGDKVSYDAGFNTYGGVITEISDGYCTVHWEVQISDYEFSWKRLAPGQTDNYFSQALFGTPNDADVFETTRLVKQESNAW